MLGMRKVLAKYIDQRCLSVSCAIELLAGQTDRMMTVSAKERERERESEREGRACCYSVASVPVAKCSIFHCK